MNGDAQADPSVPREACELITCVLPEDGTEKELIPALRDEKQIIRANSVSCLGMAVLADARTKFGELSEPTLVRKVDVVVPESVEIPAGQPPLPDALATENRCSSYRVLRRCDNPPGWRQTG